MRSIRINPLDNVAVMLDDSSPEVPRGHKFALRDIAAGEITYGDIISVHPYNNQATSVRVTGQQLLDALWDKNGHFVNDNTLTVTMKRLRDLGNTLIVVEHDEDTMRQADYIVDVGPGAGVHGGEIVAAGSVKDICKAKRSVTVA